MRRRLSLETLESRLVPTTLGTLTFDSQSFAVNFAPAAAGTTPGQSSSQSASTIALAAPSASSPTSFNATVGNFSTSNGSDSYYIANAVQGSTLNLALGGNGTIGLSVYDQNGVLLAQQTGSLAIGLTLTNLPATGGVTVVVTAASPTGYLLTSMLSTPSASSSTPLFQSGGGSLGPQLIDPSEVAASGTGLNDPMSSPDWVNTGNMILYDPIGRPIEPWSPPAGYTAPTGIPFNPPPPTTTSTTTSTTSTTTTP